MKEVRFLGLGKGLFFMKRKFRNPVEMVTRIATLAILSALGFVLMAFLQFPYPFAPWLKIEISEIVTVLAYALYGLPGGITVAIIKTLLNLAVHGPVGLGIGDLTAFITSCMYILGLFVTSRLKLFKKGVGFRFIAYGIISIFVSTIMTALNAIVITPSYLTVFGSDPHFSTCFEDGVIQNTAAYLTGNKDITVNGWGYVGIISAIYLPFNFIKATLCLLGYEALFNQIIFLLMKRSPFFQKWFVGDIFTKKEEEVNPDLTVEEEKPQK